MSKFRKKPVVVEAVQFLGMSKEAGPGTLTPEFTEGFDPWLSAALASGMIRPHPVWPETRLQVVTLEDDPTAPETAQIVDKGDWIVQGVKGELYPCKPDIFEATYEPAE